MSTVLTHECGTSVRVPAGFVSGRLRCPKCKGDIAVAAQDPYTILGVAHGATDQEIKLAYRRVARQTHPDATGSADSKAFRTATDAYSLLSDPEARAAYDKSGEVDTGAVQERREEIFAAIAYVRQVAAVARGRARASVIKGLLWFSGGATVTIVGYATAKPGQSVPIFWGAIAFGGLQAIRGWIAAVRIRSAAAALERDLFATLGD
jgi:curved DNA-binding protein CbpA